MQNTNVERLSAERGQDHQGDPAPATSLSNPPHPGHLPTIQEWSGFPDPDGLIDAQWPIAVSDAIDFFSHLLSEGSDQAPFVLDAFTEWNDRLTCRLQQTSSLSPEHLALWNESAHAFQRAREVVLNASLAIPPSSPLWDQLPAASIFAATRSATPPHALFSLPVLRKVAAHPNGPSFVRILSFDLSAGAASLRQSLTAALLVSRRTKNVPEWILDEFLSGPDASVKQLLQAFPLDLLEHPSICARAARDELLACLSSSVPGSAPSETLL